MCVHILTYVGVHMYNYFYMYPSVTTHKFILIFSTTNTIRTILSFYPCLSVTSYDSDKPGYDHPPCIKLSFNLYTYIWVLEFLKPCSWGNSLQTRGCCFCTTLLPLALWSLMFLGHHVFPCPFSESISQTSNIVRLFCHNLIFTWDPLYSYMIS